MNSSEIYFQRDTETDSEKLAAISILESQFQLGMKSYRFRM